MDKIFNMDSKVMRAMSMGADLVLLNLMFLVCCLPVVTIGPAMTALYRVTYAMGTKRENGVIRTYFTAFRENFGTAVKIWLLILAAATALYLDMVLVANMGGALIYCNVGFGILALLALLGTAMVFPLLSLFKNSVLEAVKNALILGIANLPRTVVILLMWLMPLIVLFRYPIVFFSVGILWIGIYFSAAAYLSSRLLRPVFGRFLPEDFDEEEEEAV